LRYDYEVVPCNNTRARSIKEEAPPPDLSVHHKDVTATLRLNEPNNILDGVGGAVAQGAFLGKE
jgi:hypothetical protein